jgi:hypothetical protein
MALLTSLMMTAHSLQAIRALTEWVALTPMVTAIPMRMQTGRLPTVRMHSRPTLLNTLTKTVMALATTHQETWLMTVQLLLEIHGKMEHLDVQTLTKMDGLITKIRTLMMSHSGLTSMAMVTATI